MSTRVVLTALCLVAGWMATSTFALADPGESATDAAGELVDLEGTGFDLVDTVEGHEATILVWYATTCPCVLRYEDRFAAVRASWPAEQVAMIGIASNADDDLNRLRAELADKPFPLPVVLDVGGQLARSLDVYSTPTVVLLDSEGNVRFQGWLDNEEDLDDDDREPYLEEALEAILRGQSVERPDSPIYGCPMTRSL